jgi:hypothetical protein
LKLRQFKKQRGEWQELEHLTKVANENRNKFAHYALDYDLIGQSNNPDGTVRITFGPHRLRPTVRNFYSRLQGRTPDKEEHNLGPKQITQYIGEFGQLAERLEKFHVSLSPRLEDRP